MNLCGVYFGPGRFVFPALRDGNDDQRSGYPQIPQVGVNRPEQISAR